MTRLLVFAALALMLAGCDRAETRTITVVPDSSRTVYHGAWAMYETIIYEKGRSISVARHVVVIPGDTLKIVVPK